MCRMRGGEIQVNVLADGKKLGVKFVGGHVTTRRFGESKLNRVNKIPDLSITVWSDVPRYADEPICEVSKRLATRKVLHQVLANCRF